jgi:hypothetical protein
MDLMPMNPFYWRERVSYLGLQRCPQVTNWCESCMISPRRHHAVTDHPARHDLSLPVAFGEHRMMLRPRDSHDQRVIEARLEITPEPTSLRLVQDAFGNHVGIARFSGRSRELCFESTVCLEHSPLHAADLDLEDAARTFPVVYSADEMPDLAYCMERHQSDPRNEVGRWARQFLPPPWVDWPFRASHSALTGYQSRLPLPAAGSEGNPAAGGDAPARPW